MIDLFLASDMAARAASKTARSYHGATTIHPLAILAVTTLASWLLVASRRTAVYPLLILTCFIPSAQRIVVAGADFTLLRIMVLAGMVRVVMKQEIKSITPNRLDCVFFSWVLIGSLVYVIQRGDLSALIYVCGTSMDMLGAYLLTRVLIRNVADLRSFALAASFLAAAVGFFFALEMATGRNLFSTFGGVPARTAIRDGRLRCQGAFSHPILAGVFWAAVGALVAGGALSQWNRIRFSIGLLACVVIVIASSSSTPLLGLIAGVGLWSCWPIRSKLRYVVYITPWILLGLHFSMEAPVWHLVSRVSAVGGSTAYHRYVLINGAIVHIHEWWLTGAVSTSHWSDNFQTFDITNQYIFEGVRGGVWRLGLFLCLVYIAFKSAAKSMQLTKVKAEKLLIWGFTVSLFVHCVCFIGVSYFGQIQYLWYISLGIAGSMESREFTEMRKSCPT